MLAGAKAAEAYTQAIEAHGADPGGGPEVPLRFSKRGAGAPAPCVIAAIQNPDAITAILAADHSDRWFIPGTGPRS